MHQHASGHKFGLGSQINRSRERIHESKILRRSRIITYFPCGCTSSSNWSGHTYLQKRFNHRLRSIRDFFVHDLSDRYQAQNLVEHFLYFSRCFSPAVILAE